MIDMESPERLVMDVSPSMAHAAAALCDLKVSMDRYARGYIGQPFLNDWMDHDGTCASWGSEFLRLVMPFLEWESREGPAFRAFVDPTYVLGASIKGLPEHVPEKDVPARIARYATTFQSRDHVFYVWYKPLGILIAHEGKHRVAFMRAHQQPVIAAWVQEAAYPSPDRIVIIQPDEDGEVWLAILDGRYVQVLRRPHVSLLMLRAYGVAVRRWHDLSDVPAKARVLLDIYQLGLHTERRTTCEAARTLDLDAWRRRDRRDGEMIVRSIHELEPYRLAWRPYGIATVACLALTLVMQLLPWTVAHSIGWVSLGASIGLLAALELLRWRGPRRVVGGSREWDH